MRTLLFSLLCFLLPAKAHALSWNNKVYLASYPKSGNHWLRYLIEEATLIATTSVYCDQDHPKHLYKPFPWGGYCAPNGYEGNCRYPTPADILVIKTHHPVFCPERLDNQPYKKVILLVRHPIDSLYSFYLGAPPVSRVPLKDLIKFLAEWRTFQEFWSKKNNVLIIRYEDLYTHPEETLTKILKAIGYKKKRSYVKRAVQKYPPQGGIYKYHKFLHPKDLEFVDEAIGDLLKQYGYSVGHF